MGRRSRAALAVMGVAVLVGTQAGANLRTERTGSPVGAARPRFAVPMAFRFRAPGPRRHRRRLAQSKR